MASIGIGVLSFAHGHAATYCDTLQSNPGASLIAAWDDSATRGAENAARFGMELCSSPEALLARDDVDAVIIACETNRHAELVEAACAAGKNILCQKPMATTLEECDRIIAAVENSGVHFQMAFQMRCDPLNRQIRKWIDDGAIGNIGAIRRRHCLDIFFNESFVQGAGAWHFDAQKNVGMFFDDASHAADFLFWIMGRPVSVMAEIENTLTSFSPDDCGLAIYKWQTENGAALGALFNASVILAGENTCEVYGDEGVIIQNFDDQTSTAHANGAPALKLFHRATRSWEYPRLEVPASHGARIAAVAEEWIEILRSRKAPTVSARDGKVSVEMCLAAYRSAATGQRISL
jgi:predicted dehydrogenase